MARTHGIVRQRFAYLLSHISAVELTRVRVVLCNRSRVWGKSIDWYAFLSRTARSQLLYPNHFFLARGNHECINMNKMYGFDGEVKHKGNDIMVELFHEVLGSCYTLPPFLVLCACTLADRKRTNVRIHASVSCGVEAGAGLRHSICFPG